MAHLKCSTLLCEIRLSQANLSSFHILLNIYIYIYYCGNKIRMNKESCYPYEQKKVISLYDMVLNMGKEAT